MCMETTAKARSITPQVKIFVRLCTTRGIFVSHSTLPLIRTSLRIRFRRGPQSKLCLMRTPRRSLCSRRPQSTLPLMRITRRRGCTRIELWTRSFFVAAATPTTALQCQRHRVLFSFPLPPFSAETVQDTAVLAVDCSVRCRAIWLATPMEATAHTFQMRP